MAESQKQKSPTDSILKPAVLQSPVIMKIDSPVEDSMKNENDTNERNANAAAPKGDDFRMCSPSYRPSVPTVNPFASTQGRIGRGILKPPQLNVNSVSATSNKPFVLKPSQLNPFGKSSDSSDKTNGENGDKSQNIVNGEAPKFVPLVVSESKKPENSPTTSTKQTSSTSPNTATPSFVFGQNLQERVVTNETNSEESKASTSLNSNDSNGTSEDKGATEMLFSSVIKNEVKSDNAAREKETKSLSESAREYEESRANKRKYDEVEVITGEENENNILNISCKLFSFDKTVSSNSSSYIERGRGTLRLNDFLVDDDHIGSRIVFRTSGSLRVILNTKIWAKMTIQKASDKSIRFTALDANGEIKVFLITSSIEDSNKLFSHLQVRLEREISAQKRKKVISSSEVDSGGN